MKAEDLKKAAGMYDDIKALQKVLSGIGRPEAALVFNGVNIIVNADTCHRYIEEEVKRLQANLAALGVY